VGVGPTGETEILDIRDEAHGNILSKFMIDPKRWDEAGEQAEYRPGKMLSKMTDPERWEDDQRNCALSKTT
jgi:hypothetical protein